MLTSWEDFSMKPPYPPTTPSALGVDVERQRAATSTRKSKKKRRFSDEQIMSLESMFHAESRPELSLKQHMAIQLGLQPRQVAIWFQNKRARSKSKQIEHDFNMLKIRYTTLASKFGLLKKENQSLQDQLQGLRNLLERPHESIDSCGSGRSGVKIGDEEHDNQDIVAKEKPKSPLEAYNLESGIPSNDNNMEYFEEETSIRNKEEVDDYLTSIIIGSFESSCLPEYSSILDI